MNLSYEKHDFLPGSLYFHQEASIWTSLTPLYWTIGVTLEKLCLQASVFPSVKWERVAGYVFLSNSFIEVTGI